MSRKCIPFLSLTFLLVGCALLSTTHLGPSPNDALALRQMMLNWAVLGQNPPGLQSPLPDSNLITDYKIIVIEDDGSPEIRELTLPRYEIMILSPDQIQARADAQGDFLHFRFNKVEIEGNQATVSLDMIWAVSVQTKESGVAHLSGDGAEVNFVKEKGAWRALEPAMMWIS